MDGYNYNSYQSQKAAEATKQAMEESAMELPIAIGIIALVCIVIIIIGVYITKHKDDKKPTLTQVAKIIDKLPPEQSTAMREEWFIVEAVDGTRFKLRNMRNSGMFLAVGDFGTITYRGQTILSFNRK